MTSVNFFEDVTRMISEAGAGRFSVWGNPDLGNAVILERPAARQHGDLSTNIAMIAASTAGRAPRELAIELIDDLKTDERLSGLFQSIELAGPGFINFFLTSEALVQAARDSLAQASDYGSGTSAKSQNILLEFVSANPTGPLHVGHARYAAYGDSLARILNFSGRKVTTEFYINDYGSQMNLFGKSIAARYAQSFGIHAKLPEDGYQGDYPVHIAEVIRSEIGDRFITDADQEPDDEAVKFFRNRGCELVLDEMRVNLDRFRVSFDVWFSESRLYDEGEVKASIDELRQAGEVIEKEEALWLRTSRYGDDKDRVLIRGTGDPTYFASDIAYHRDKLGRGFNKLINIWGADHHGYVPRMKAAFEALAHDPDKLEIIIGQLVNVVEMGEKKQMSKRAGTMVSLKELLDSIGVDAARFFLVDRSHDSTLDLDLEKAKLKSEENPVYYVQYAHARICSILRKAETEMAEGSSDSVYEAVEAQERELILKLLEFPLAVQTAAENRGPQRLTAYARELAATFHTFYHNCPVIKAAPGTAQFRIDLCSLTRNVISSCLHLVGVSAPESI
ncbi:MAG: arginine--tRNA ligase [Thermoleophilia bacterium]|jgi:arginyl-tRNA synthetase